MRPARPGGRAALVLLLAASAACRPRRSGPEARPVPAPAPARRADGPAPVRSFLALVAGSGDAGHHDGPFSEAQFAGPSGLALSPDGRLLVVADRDGHRLRGIRLAEGHRVETLAGTGAPGSADGPLASATFNGPALVQFAGPQTLAVWDAGTGRLRKVDLAAGRVTTLVPSDGRPLAAVFALAIAAGGAVTTQPAGRIVLTDLATGARRVLLEGNAALPRPGPMAVLGNDVFVAPADTGGLFRLRIPASGPGLLERAGEGDRLAALCVAGDRLYGLRAEARPALVRLPANEPVPLPSAWGGEIDEKVARRSFFALPAEGPVALAGDGEGPVLYVAHPALHLVLSVRDRDQAARRNGMAPLPEGPDDFAYPKSKPAGVYRILLVGDSHLFHATFPEISGGFFERTATVPKRLELLLNTRAALDGRERSFEVLTKARVAWLPLMTWPVTDVPPVSRGWQVDLVVLMLSRSTNTLDAYLNHPIQPNGLPASSPDPEYLLLPPEKKLAASPAAKLWSVARPRGWALVSDSGFLHIPTSDGELASVPEARAELHELYGRPLAELARAVRPARLAVCLFPSGERIGMARERDLWAEICRKRDVDFVDLVPKVTALRETYYPISQMDESDHFSAAGMVFLAEVLSHELAARGLLPD